MPHDISFGADRTFSLLKRLVGCSANVGVSSTEIATESAAASAGLRIRPAADGQRGVPSTKLPSSNRFNVGMDVEGSDLPTAHQISG